MPKKTKPKTGNPFYKGASPEDVARALLMPRENEITKRPLASHATSGGGLTPSVTPEPRNLSAEDEGPPSSEPIA